VKILTKYKGQAQSRDRTLHALAAPDCHHSVVERYEGQPRLMTQSRKPAGRFRPAADLRAARLRGQSQRANWRSAARRRRTVLASLPAAMSSAAYCWICTRVSSTGCSLRSHHSRHSRTPRREDVMAVGDLFSASRLISHEFSSPWRSSAGNGDLLIPIYLLGDACRYRRLNQDRVQA